MAAYAALVSLMNTIQQIQNHPRLSTSLNKNQIESLVEKLDFLLDFIESYNSRRGSKEEADLESQIVSAAHAAEDVIESHIVDQILAGSTPDHGKARSSFNNNLQKQIKAMMKKVEQNIRSEGNKFRRQKAIFAGSTEKVPRFLLDLEKIIESMDSIQKKVVNVKEERGFKAQQATYSNPAAPSRPLTSGKNTMVGFNDELIQLMDWLTGQQTNLQIIPIVGMAGIGKTTLARNVYKNLFVVQHFDIRAWATISQACNVREIILELLSCLGNQESNEYLSAFDSTVDQEIEDQLGVNLYQCLSGRRYLVVLDDIWSVEAWDKIKFFFPDNNNTSRVVLTTRLSTVAFHFSSSSLSMNFLDEDKSWNLFCEKAFPKEGCPPELEEIGKKIVRKCGGLPLSIVVIGGLLGKSSRTREYWENVASDINSILKSEEDEHCFNVLSLSYSHLPAHLKPCFLYMGIFPEDHEISVSQLIKLWVAEGFLKSNKTQRLEEIAEDYFKDLVDRNLILISMWRWNGKIKYCTIHDLLRELCLSLAEKENFLYVMRVLDSPRDIHGKRRIVLHEDIPVQEHYPAPLARSFIRKGGPLPFEFRLLRVLTVVARASPEAIFQQVNLRYLFYGPSWGGSLRMPSELPSSISLLWNLQTLIIGGNTQRIAAPIEIWNMRQLRHLHFNEVYLPDPPPSDTTDQQDDIVLENLQTLATVLNFRLSEEVCKRIPNIQKLRLRYADFSVDCQTIYYCLNNLGCLHKLQSLNCFFSRKVERVHLLQNLTFPSSVHKLTLENCQLHWEAVTMIGLSLLHLEVLKLEKFSVVGPDWNVVEGAFPCLKFLRICCEDLIYWNADNSHFPVLEKLILQNLYELDGIPLGMAEIPTLRYIRLHLCNESAAVSSIKIMEEQLNLGYEDLQVSIQFVDTTEEESFREKVDIESYRGKVETQSFISNYFHDTEAFNFQVSP